MLKDLIHDWNDSEPLGDGERMPEVNDETLRDGLQAAYVVSPSLHDRIALLEMLEKLGVHAINIGLPGAGGTVREDTLALAKELVGRRLKISPNCAGRTVIADAKAIADVSQEAGCEIEACLFIGSSPIRMDVQGWTIDTLLGNLTTSIEFAVREGLPVMFVTEDTTRASPDTLERLYVAAADCGVKRVCLSDTVGHATPDGVAALVAFVRSVLNGYGYNDVKIDYHGHMDRGLGIWNAITAFRAGADRLHGSALGIGERVGNVPLDLLLINLKLMGLWTGDVSALDSYCRIASEAVGLSIPPNYPVFGSGAFETGTGVHADAIIKALRRGDMALADQVYSGVPASWVGRRQVIRVGPQSGRSNITWWLEERGIEATPARVDAIFAAAKNSVRLLEDSEIRIILAPLG